MTLNKMIKYCNKFGVSSFFSGICKNCKNIFFTRWNAENDFGMFCSNGIKNDNRIENLQIMSNSEHAKFHKINK